MAQMDRGMAVWVGSEEVRSRALVGAQRCIDHWASEDEDDMLAEAIARLHRIEDGTALVCEVEGALDWLDA